jgi:hypothetical protein
MLPFGLIRMSLDADLSRRFPGGCGTRPTRCCVPESLFRWRPLRVPPGLVVPGRAARREGPGALRPQGVNGKDLFSWKGSCTYSMQNLPQEKNLPAIRAAANNSLRALADEGG